MEEKKIFRRNEFNVIIAMLTLILSFGFDFYSLSKGNLTHLSLFLTFVVTICVIIALVSGTIVFALKEFKSTLDEIEPTMDEIIQRDLQMYVNELENEENEITEENDD